MVGEVKQYGLGRLIEVRWEDGDRLIDKGNGKKE